MSIDLPAYDANIRSVKDQTNSETQIVKYRWKDENRNAYCENVTSESFRSLIDEAMNHIYVNPDVALNRLNECIKDAAVCMKSVIVPNKNKEQQWFDYECITKRREVRKALRHFNKSIVKLNRMVYEQQMRSDDDDVLNDIGNIENAKEMSNNLRQNYCVNRREYNRLLERKRKEV